MFHLEPYFCEHEDPTHDDMLCGSSKVADVLDRLVLENDQTAGYRQVAKDIILKCHEDPNALIDLFDTICRDLSNPDLTDKCETFELIMSALAGTYHLDSTAGFREYVEERYRENLQETPKLCKLINQAFILLDASDIDIVLSSSSLDAIFRKTIRINDSNTYNRNLHKFDTDFIPTIESYLDLDAADLERIFNLADKYLNQILATVEDKDKCPSADLIARSLAAIASASKSNMVEVVRYCESLITSENDFLAEIAGYTLALIKELTPRFGDEIFQRLTDGFNEAQHEDKEFWTVAMSEFSCYDLKVAKKCIGLLQPLIDGTDEFRVSYASEAIAKIVNQVGGSTWNAASITEVGKYLIQEEDPLFNISHQQRIIFISKSIASIDSDNYAQVITDIEDLLYTLSGNSLFSKVRDGIFATLEDIVPYTANRIHEEVLKRVQLAVSSQQLTPEISDLYAHLLNSSFISYIEADQKDKRIDEADLVDIYSELSEKLRHSCGNESLTQITEDIGRYLFASQIFGFSVNYPNESTKPD